MPTALIVTGLVLAGLLLLLLLPVKLTLKYKNGFLLRVSFLFFAISRYPKPRERIRVKDCTPKKVQKKKRKSQAALRAKSRHKEESAPELGEQLDRLRLWLPPILQALERHTVLRTNRIHVTVGSEDAAKTAVLYGAISQGIAYLCELVDTYVPVKRGHGSIRVRADFAAETTVADIKLTLSVRAAAALHILFKVALAFLKKKNTSDEPSKKDDSKEN